MNFYRAIAFVLITISVIVTTCSHGFKPAPQKQEFIHT